MKEKVKPDKIKYKEKNKKASKHAKQKKGGRGWIIAGSILLVFAIMLTYAVTNYETVLSWFGISKDFSAGLDSNAKYSMLSVKESLYDNLDPNILLGDTDTINILLFGLDEDEERRSEYTIFRPDTVMLISVNFVNKGISIISIPRDTYLNIYGRGGKDKINTCFYYGSMKSYNTEEELFQNGVDTLKGTVSEILGGIPINYYVGVNMDTAAQIIDEIGGVYFELDRDLYYDDTHLFFTAQSKVWTGSEFINMARLRGYANGDIERTSMQQKLLKALFEAVKSMKVSKIPGVVKLAFKSVQTNFDTKTAVSFALAAMDIDSSNIQTATIPGMFGNYYGVSYWIVNQSARVSFVKQFYGFAPSYLEQDPTLKVEEVAPVEPPVEGEGEGGGEGGEGGEGGGEGGEGGGGGA